MSEVFGAVIELKSNVSAVLQHSIGSARDFRGEVTKAKERLKEYDKQKVKEKELKIKNTAAYRAIDGVKKKLEPVTDKVVEIKARAERAEEKIHDVRRKLDGIRENKVINFVMKGTGAVARAAGKAALAGTAAAFTAVAVAGTAAVTQGVAFESQMKNVGTLLDGDVGAKLQSMGTELKKVSMDTGVATADLTDGLYQTVSAFGESAESVRQLEIAAKAAKAGGATTTDAVNLLSAVTKGYGDTSATAMQKVSDMAFQTVKLGQTTFPELASSMGGVVAMSSQMGVSQEELFGSLATLTGVTGGTAEVCTQLEGVMSSFLSPSESMSKALKKMGYASGAAALEAEGMEGIIGRLKDTVGGDSIELSKLFGEKTAKQAVLALTGDLADTWHEKTAAMAESSNAANKAFEMQQSSVESMVNRVKNAGKVMLTSVGEKALPYIVSALEKVIDKLPALEAAFDTVADNIGPAIELVSSALGPILEQWQPVLEEIGGYFADAFGEGGSIAAAAAFIGPAIQGISSVAAEVFPVIAGIAQDLGSKFTAAFGKIGEHTEFIQELLSTAGPAIADALSTAWEVIGPILDLAIEAVDLLMTVFEKVFPAIEAVVSRVWKVIRPIFENMGKAAEFLSGAVGKVGDALSGISSAEFLAGAAGKAAGHDGAKGTSAGMSIAENATGTEYFTGGWTTVGEHGPELMRLPTGTKIKSNVASGSMAGNGKGQYSINIAHMEVRKESDIDKIAEAIVKKIEDADDNM